MAMSFNVEAIRGRRVKHAELVCRAATQTISGVTISTIATPWSEMESTGLKSGAEGVEGWGYAGARFPAASGGNSFTLTAPAASVVRDGAYHWEVLPDMVHALATGVAFGLAVHEHEADYGRNPSIFSREQSGQQPWLVVDVDDQPDEVPLPPTGLKLSPVDATTAQMTLQAPSSGFAYEVQVDGQLLGRHNLPLVRPGSSQLIPLRDLPTSVTQPGMHAVAVVTISRTGQRSAAAVVQGELFSFEAPALPTVTWRPATHPAVADVAVVPVTDKYDQNGKPVGDLPADYRTHNSIFDGHAIRLTAAAGEVVGFQVLARGSSDVAVRCQLDVAWRVDLFQAVYVPAGGRRIPDPLLPLDETIRLAPDQDQSVFVDVYVPFDARPGTRNGRLSLSDGRSVPVELTVLPVQLPRRASFLCEMNSYGLPDRVDEFYALQQVAYDHRVHANILHYSHTTAAAGARKSNLDMRLQSGRRMDNRRYDSVQPGATQGWWDDFVEAFGPYL
ncbi:MAG: hypothetical protein AB7O38_16270, partial [Pirellulaceae bacterium]